MRVKRPESKQPLPPDAKLVFAGKLFDVYHWQAEAYDGTTRIFEKLKRPDSAMIIPVTEDGKIIMSRQEQPGKQPFTSLIGGRVDEGEDVHEAAKRELLEETGYASEDWELFDAVQPNSKIEWAVYTFIARGCKKIAEQSLDGAEKIELMQVSFEEFVSLVCEDEFNDMELKVMFLKALQNPEMFEGIKKSILG